MVFTKLNFYLFLFASLTSAATIQVNQVGYERSGSKTAVYQCDESCAFISDFTVVNSTGSVAFSGKAASAVSLWKNRSFQVLDFSALQTNGTYTIVSGYLKSAPFDIGENFLFEKTASSVLGFFDSMRNTDDDHAVPFFSDSSKTHDVYGGWSDATGDRGKYLSHLSFANYFNPQQIPMVVWVLAKSYELDKARFKDTTPDILKLAGWGADYLLRVLDEQNFFYITIFDGWGMQKRQICAWENSEGDKVPELQAGMREGAGMSIAALARMARMESGGDSSSAQYLAGAERAYAHILLNNLKYADDGKENMIDDYCGLMAATELYLTTKNETYLTDTKARVQRIADHQHKDGWFWADDAKTRPFYHAADEGFPIVALTEFLKTQSSPDLAKSTIKKAVNWYLSTSGTTENPFQYPCLMRISNGTSENSNLALKKTYLASQSETSPYNGPASQAFDGDQNTRWACGSPYVDTAWIQVDLGADYNINKVVLNWETAFGKEYAIKISTDAAKWTNAATVTNGSTGIKEISFPPVKGRYVRMQGISFATSYGYSIYEFQVYGSAASTSEVAKGFFIPHSNETGYWWQGENARVSSVAAALQMAITIPDLFSQDVRMAAKQIATSNLDWVLGKNPFGVCFLYGFGTATYPSYPGKNGFANYKGGICNGITSGLDDEADIAWMAYPEGENYWQNWRYIEQWLPHDSWYLLAIAQQSYMYDTPYIEHIISQSNRKQSLKQNAFRINIINKDLHLTLLSSANTQKLEIELTDLKGRSIVPRILSVKNNHMTIAASDFAAGFYFVRINKFSSWQQFSIGL